MSEIGEQQVSVREVVGPPRNVFQNLGEGGQVAFSDYLAWVLDTANQVLPTTAAAKDIRALVELVDSREFEASYYLDANLVALSTPMVRQVPVPPWFRRQPRDINLWCGVIGTSSGLHCDVTPNCNMQVIGEKHFSLFAPSESARVYRLSPRSTHCRFDPNRPDLNRFPLAQDASGSQCVLQPGNALYIPAGWFHQVTVKSGWAVNINIFWPRPFPQGLMLPMLWRFFLQRGRARLRERYRHGVARRGDRGAAA